MSSIRSRKEYDYEDTLGTIWNDLCRGATKENVLAAQTKLYFAMHHVWSRESVMKEAAVGEVQLGNTMQAVYILRQKIAKEMMAGRKVYST
jgi:hypothetical protein